MKIVALLVAFLMSGCALQRVPTRTDANEKRDVPTVLVVCIFASCRDACRKPVTPP